MARLNVPTQNLTITAAAEIRAYVEPFGMWYERWEVAGRLPEKATAQDILEAFKPEIEKLNARGGFVTADVINVNPETPGLDAMLAKFSTEHTHSEDEVSFVVSGKGIFHINPETAPVFSVEMEEGDLINVPVGTRHWFNLCADRTICTIRLFQDITGWTPHYMEDAVDKDYSPLCFNPGQVKAEKEIKLVVKP